MACSNCGKSVFEQAKNIATGALNITFKDEGIELIALPRLKICQSCEFIKELIKVGDKRVIQCTKCMCLCELKVRVEKEVCPIGKW